MSLIDAFPLSVCSALLLPNCDDEGFTSCFSFEIRDKNSRQISELADPGALYSSLMDLIVRLARSGLIHGDFNEFNILIMEHGRDINRSHGDRQQDDAAPADGQPPPPPVPVLIDFPQMVSTDHENAE
jgi:RIO kinase 2